MPLLLRQDPVLSSWEINFLENQRVHRNRHPTLEQGNKLNTIYECKYLRGVRS
jgi:hypothetical protein